MRTVLLSRIASARRAQNVKIPLLTGRTVPFLLAWFATRPYSTYKLTACHTGDGLIPDNKYKAPPGAQSQATMGSRDTGRWDAERREGRATVGERPKLNRGLRPDVWVVTQRIRSSTHRQEHAMRDDGWG